MLRSSDFVVDFWVPSSLAFFDLYVHLWFGLLLACWLCLKM